MSTTVLQSISAFLHRYRFQFVAIVSGPSLILAAIVIGVIGLVVDLPAMCWWGEFLLSLALLLLPAIGITCGLWSWQMARHQPQESSDTNDAVELLLGFCGVMETGLGSFLWPNAAWVLMHCLLVPA